MNFSGYTLDAVLNFNDSEETTYPAVTVTNNYNTINNYQLANIPIITPYGFVSVPVDNAKCVYAGTGNFQASFVQGYVNTLPTDSNLGDLEVGETGLFSSGNFTFKIKNDKLWVTFTNTDNEVISTRITNDENVNTILIDTIAEINALELKFNNFLLLFNAHVHSGVAPGGSNTGIFVGTPVSPYDPTDNFVRDDDFLGSDGFNNFVDENGMVIS